jgi:hypothetical protein
MSIIFFNSRRKIMKQKNLFCGSAALFFSIVTISVLLIVTGCKYVQLKAPGTSQFCDNVPEGQESVICQIADRVGTTPESIVKIVRATNLIGLDQWYTARQADDFILDLIKAAESARELAMSGDGTTTWETLSNYVQEKYGALPPKIQASFILLSDVVEIDAPDLEVKVIPVYDWDGIISALQQQRGDISKYMK